jgi:hypothetical protein
VARARKVAHDLNLAVNCETNERALHVFIPARDLVVCTKERVEGIIPACW